MRTHTESALIAGDGPLVRRRPEQIVADAGYDVADWTLDDYDRALWSRDDMMEVCGLGPWAGLPFSTDPVTPRGVSVRKGLQEEPLQAGFLGRHWLSSHPGASAPPHPARPAE
jgi:hypothetical protein